VHPLRKRGNTTAREDQRCSFLIRSTCAIILPKTQVRPLPLLDILAPPTCAYRPKLRYFDFATHHPLERDITAWRATQLIFKRGPLPIRHMRSSPTPPSSLSRLLSNSNSSHQNMPRTAERSMPSVSSPLSPRSDPMAIPSQGHRRPGPTSRQSSNAPGHLRLPSLPRFHPANFPSSQNSSLAASPITGPNSPNTPSSPRSNSTRHEVQRQMYAYQQQLLANTSRQVRGPGSMKPTSPRLAPLASPGAVTPLELGAADGYLTAGINPEDAAQHVEQLIRNEARRRGDYSHGRPTSFR
jgi:hypothetical protein